MSSDDTDHKGLSVSQGTSEDASEPTAETECTPLTRSGRHNTDASLMRSSEGYDVGV